MPIHNSGLKRRWKAASRPAAAGRRLPLAVASLLAAIALLLPAQAAPRLKPAGAAREWRQSALTLPPSARPEQTFDNRTARICFDTSRPHTFFIWEQEGTVAYNWETGSRRVVNSLSYELCGPNGLLYSRDPGAGRVLRWSLDQPAGRVVQYLPTHIAEDGSSQVYALHADGPNSGRFSASADGGLTWRLRGQQFGGQIRQLVVSPADARALYVLVRKPVTESSGDYTIFYSADEGATWTPRATERIEGEGFASVWLEVVPGRSAPVAMLLRQKSFGSGSNGYRTTELSIDGGASFREVARSGRDRGAQVFRTSFGLLRLNRILYGYTLEATADSGAPWQPRPLPDIVKPRPDGPPHETVEITPIPNAANTFVVGDFKGSGDLWLSSDAGASWTRLARNMRFITPVPYAPHTLLGFENGKLYVLDLPETDRTVADPAANAGAPGGAYYPETRHNMSRLFKGYWEANGGLAQFGYPKTEPFLELNPSDGRVYLVQYFERNRFEWHPEFAGTRYEVLLGLLGNQLTAARRAAGEGPFNRVADPQIAGQFYFPETGHTLRNSFKQYWEANGGLAQFGYPLTEEFMEVNPDDGQTYVVQYFERNRFEWHPEHRGTRYEVLLGLLGNSLLRLKGWQ